MSRKKTIPWETIRNEYRVNMLSNREIARRFGISEGAIRKRAKAEGWERDLAAKVRELIRRKLWGLGVAEYARKYAPPRARGKR